MRFTLVMFLLFTASAHAEPPITGSVRVVDGDTIQIGEARIRIWGIDAPEMGDAHGPASKSALHDYISGETVTCRQKDIDRYRRVVAQCFFDGQDVAEWLVSNGYARDWPKYSGGYYAQ